MGVAHPEHAVIHLVSGLLGIYFGFVRPAGAVRFLQLFALFYLALAVFGTFTPIYFGIQLELPENALRWFLGTVAAVIAWGAGDGAREGQVTR